MIRLFYIWYLNTIFNTLVEIMEQNKMQSIHYPTDKDRVSPWVKYIWEVVYGGIDGIVTTFAVVAWFVWAGATQALGSMWPLAVVLFWLANLFGDGVSMALGKFLSTKSQQDIYTRTWKKELYKIQNNPDMEEKDAIRILEEQGMTFTDAKWSIQILKNYPTLRTKWMMDHGLQMPDVRDEKPAIQWFITLFSFIVFWFIPLIPYVFPYHTRDGRVLSVIMTGLALLILGIVRWLVTRINFVWTVVQIVLLGAVAAAVAYYTGHLVMNIR